MVPVLQACGVWKSFRPRGTGSRGSKQLTAVRDVSLSLSRGRVLALVGESGCGKSTVARLLARLEPLSSGRILLDGEEVPRRLATGRRNYTSHVQILLQDPYGQLNASYSIRHHMVRALRLHSNLRGRELDERAGAVLEEVNLSPGEDYLARYPHELSGGQRQRVAIARALSVGPEVLLADEPVSMLDVSIRLEILRLLESLTQERNLALLYITHDIASARYFAHQTAVMYAAELVELGPSEDVTQEPAHPYTRLLISATPNPDRRSSQGSQDTLLGEPPSLADPPTGCRFHPRCPWAMDICRTTSPPPFEVGAHHWARCWLHSSDKRAAAEPVTGGDAAPL